MRRILVKSLNEAFDFVMDHYYPAGCEEDAKRKDTYAVISIQDTHTGGFGVTFAENKFCKGVLTLYFDDVVKETKGAVLFDENMADSVIAFMQSYGCRYAVNSLLCRTVKIACNRSICEKNDGKEQSNIFFGR